MTPDHDPARKSLESERAELEAIADGLEAFADETIMHSAHEQLMWKAASALRSLAAQDQKPAPADEFFAEKSDMDVAKFINLALLMCQGISEQDAGFDTVTSMNDAGLEKVASIIGRVRHNAPPDTGAKLIDPIDSLKGARKQAAENHASMMRPHGGADAGVREVLRRVVAELEAMRALCALMIFEPDHGKPHPLKDGVYDKRMQAAYDVINAAEATLSHQSSLAPSVSEIIDAMVKRWIDEKWDKAFRDDCERLVDATSAAMCQPDAAETNASAEARLREALRDLVALVSTDRRYDDSESLRSARNILFAENKTAMAALSAHPHASDCDKTTYDVLGDQRTCVGVPASGLAKMMAAIENPPQPNEALKKLMRDHASDCDKKEPSYVSSSEPRGCPTPGACSCPSDRTADVTEEELAKFIKQKMNAELFTHEANAVAKVVFDAFTMGRR